MTKLFVLLIFAEARSFLTPDQVRRKLQPSPDRRSLYSYLARLRGQGLLERGPNRRRGWLSYRLTSRGEERVAYLRVQRREGHSALFRGHSVDSQDRRGVAFSPGRFSFALDLQALLRHSDVKTTLQLYAHSVSEDRMAAQGEMHEAILQSSSSTVN